MTVAEQVRTDDVVVRAPAAQQDDVVIAPTRPSPVSELVAGPWGWAPLLSLGSAVALLLIAVAFNGARAGAWWTDLPFWVGLIALFVPTAARLLAAGAARRERLALVSLFGVGLYLVKIFQYPLYFTYHDEFIHWRTARDILRYDTLFSPNSLIPASPLFPGLEIVTTALVDLSGLSIYHAGALVLGTARLVLTLALFLLYERLTDSSRLGGLAALLYLCNPKTLFFDAQFSYESLALPLAALTLFAILQRRRGRRGNWSALTIVAALGIGATVITHHLTSYALVALLGLWAIVRGVGRLRGRRTEGADPTGLLVLGALLCLAWLVYVATLVIGYLAPHIVGSLQEFLTLVGGESAGRTLFQDSTGQAAPAWERIVALAATAIILLTLPLGLREVWRRFRANSLALALAGAGAIYPATLALRLTRAGGEISDRAAVTLFIAIAFLLALGVLRLLILGRERPWAKALCLGALTILFTGEIVVGGGPLWSRVPGPYLVSADARSIEPEGIAAATWALDELGPDNRFAADRTNRLLLGSTGEQHPVTHLNDEVDVSPLFLAPGFGTTQRAIVEAGAIRYVLVDRRLGTGLPRVGIYFESNEVDANRHTTPISPEALAKFDRLLNVSLIYDSGSIQIYALGADVREP